MNGIMGGGGDSLPNWVSLITEDKSCYYSHRATKYYRIKYREFSNITGCYEIITGPRISPNEVIILKEGSNVAEANVGTSLYNPLLIFESWSSRLPIVDGKITVPLTIDNDLLVEATYHPSDDKNHFIDENGNDTETKPSTCIRAYFKYGTTGSDLSFRYDENIKSVTLPDSVTSLEVDDQFSGCNSLTSVNIPNGVTKIGTGSCTYIFSRCNSLTTINIPNSVISIAGGAFQGCSLLDTIILPDGITSIGNIAFGGCVKLKTIKIPDGIKSLGFNTFTECTSLTTVKLNNGIRTIDDSVFSGCKSLISINFPETLTSIGNAAFYKCNSLTSVNIPNGVTSIGKYAFDYCYSMKEYIFNSVTPPQLAGGFSGMPSDCKIYVPDESVDTYKTAANWSAYANKIYSILDRNA